MAKGQGKEGARIENKRKAYTAPKLVEYGKIAKLTKGSVGSKGDGGVTQRT